LFAGLINLRRRRTTKEIAASPAISGINSTISDVIMVTTNDATSLLDILRHLFGVSNYKRLRV